MPKKRSRRSALVATRPRKALLLFSLAVTLVVVGIVGIRFFGSRACSFKISPETSSPALPSKSSPAPAKSRLQLFLNRLVPSALAGTQPGCGGSGDGGGYKKIKYRVIEQTKDGHEYHNPSDCSRLKVSCHHGGWVDSFSTDAFDGLAWYSSSADGFMWFGDYSSVPAHSPHLDPHIRVCFHLAWAGGSVSPDYTLQVTEHSSGTVLSEGNVPLSTIGKMISACNNVNYSDGQDMEYRVKLNSDNGSTLAVDRVQVYIFVKCDSYSYPDQQPKDCTDASHNLPNDWSPDLEFIEG